MQFKVICQNSYLPLSQESSGDIELFYGDTEKKLDLIPAFYKELSPNEQTRADRFKHESDFNCYVSAHYFLRNELAKRLNGEPQSVNIMESEEGKPYIKEPGLPFNLSRSGEHFAFALGQDDNYIGVDIERIRNGFDYDRISRHYFSDEEQKSISGSEDLGSRVSAFFRIWTRKEAFLKAIGIGITTDLQKIELLDGENDIELSVHDIHSSSFYLSTIIFCGLAITIASSTDRKARFIQLFK
jgi:4'-phosphopantetheinyl transferase